MESILLLIIFLVFRAVIAQLFESQKVQKPPLPKTPGKTKKYSFPPKQDARPKTITIKELKSVETKPDISGIPLREKHIQKTIKQTYVKPEHQLQSETDVEIPELFSQENILRGIILQEVLSPPKALMNRRR